MAGGGLQGKLTEEMGNMGLQMCPVPKSGLSVPAFVPGNKAK